MDAYDAIVVGGGPSGIMAAGRAAVRGRRVLLIDRNRTIGAKLLISGKGRCNLTNTAALDDFIGAFGPKGRFLHNAFARFFSRDLIAFFETRGVELKVERGGRVFPVTDNARDIVQALWNFLVEHGVAVRYGAVVAEVIMAGGVVAGVALGGGEELRARRVVLATGGLSYPGTGSTGIGHAIARALGHTVVEPVPALVGLETAGPLARQWQGVSLRNVTVTVYADGKKAASRFGEMLFTHFGLSGPIVLDLSKRVGELLRGGKEVALGINFKPALDARKVDARLVREFAASGRRVKNVCESLLPKRLVMGFLGAVGIDGEKRAHQVTRLERGRLVEKLLDFRFTVKRTLPIDEAIVTAGGVATREIDPKTMASKRVPGLFIVGELLDIDAGTGGYNLQAAFSTGYVCGDAL